MCACVCVPTVGVVLMLHASVAQDPDTVLEETVVEQIEMSLYTTDSIPGLRLRVAQHFGLPVTFEDSGDAMIVCEHNDGEVKWRRPSHGLVKDTDCIHPPDLNGVTKYDILLQRGMVCCGDVGVLVTSAACVRAVRA